MRKQVQIMKHCSRFVSRHGKLSVSAYSLAGTENELWIKGTDDYI